MTKVRVLCWNVAQLPWPLNGDMGNTNISRAKQLAAIVRQIQTDPSKKVDIVCFQEFFDPSAKMTFIELTQDLFPHRIVDTRCGKYIVGMNSGLAIFSTLTLGEPRVFPYGPYHQFYDYKWTIGDSGLARKGILGVKVNVGTSGEFYMLTTHMQAGWSKPFIIFDFWKNHFNPILDTNVISTLESQEGKTFIDFMTTLNTAPTNFIFCGDFNTRSISQSSNIKGMLQNLGTIDTYNGVDPYDFGHYDYITVPYGSSGSSCYDQSYDPNLKVSDHYPLIGECELGVPAVTTTSTPEVSKSTVEPTETTPLIDMKKE